MRLIDADLYKEDMTNVFPEYYEEVLDAQPSIDAVPVTRCKDCKYYRSFITEPDVFHYCWLWTKRFKEDEYCARAESKEDDV